MKESTLDDNPGTGLKVLHDKGGFDLDKLIKKDAEGKKKHVDEHEIISVRQYIDLLKEDPSISQNAHARQFDLFHEHGVKELPWEDQVFGATKDFKLISKVLFGHAPAKAAEEYVNWLNTGAKHLKPTGQMAVVVVGPPASGKSTFVNTIIRGLEQKREPLVYQISNCPMQEEPLHALPRYIRKSHFDSEKALSAGLTQPIEDELGISDIEGDLCPYCVRTLIGWKDDDGTFHPGKHDNEGIFEWSQVEVESFTFSRQAGRGIGSFEPSDEKTQDVTDLVGKENVAVTKNPKRGYNDPNAFTLNGELEKGNRGITEAREIFKKGADERILWVFINVAAEKEIKVQGSNLPHISVDTVTVGHCNLVGFNEFAADQGQEALHSRFYVIHFPYNLRVKDQVRVYQKLIRQESELGDLQDDNGYHIAPGALELAASFEVLTHLKESKMGIDLLTKLKAYNGEAVLTELEDDEKHPIDLETLVEEGQEDDDIAKREGMFGLDARNILSALNTQIVKEPAGGCLTPLKTMRALLGMFEHVMGQSPENEKNYLALLDAQEGGSVITLYEEWAVKQVGKAFLGAYVDLAIELFDKYMQEIEYDRSRKRKMVRGDVRSIPRDELTGKPKEPDENFMRSIEERAEVTQDQADVFRGELLEYRATHPEFNYDTYEPLREAVEKKLLADARSSLTLVLAKDKPKDEQDHKRTKELFDALEEQGFCKICAKETVEKATEILNK